MQDAQVTKSLPLKSYCLKLLSIVFHKNHLFCRIIVMNTICCSLEFLMPTSPIFRGLALDQSNNLG